MADKVEAKPTKPDPAQKRKEDRQLDDALDDSFPASDPLAITQPTPSPEQDNKPKPKS
jgi:hypothetical protein